MDDDSSFISVKEDERVRASQGFHSQEASARESDVLAKIFELAFKVPPPAKPEIPPSGIVDFIVKVIGPEMTIFGLTGLIVKAEIVNLCRPKGGLTWLRNHCKK